MSDLVERWPGYDEQSWAERFAELNRRHDGLFRSFNALHEEAIKALAEKRDRIEALEREQGWQDIATAPKDGTAIIVTRVNPTGRNPAKIVWWANSTPCGWRWRQRRVIRFAPTHWRPLPAPPSGDEG